MNCNSLYHWVCKKPIRQGVVWSRPELRGHCHCQLWIISTMTSCEPLNPTCSLGPSIWPFVFPALSFYLTRSNILTSCDAVGSTAACHTSASLSATSRSLSEWVFNKYTLDKQKLCIHLCDSHHTLLPGFVLLSQCPFYPETSISLRAL